MIRRRYYTRHDVLLHDKPGDCWVSLLGGVLDLSPLFAEHIGNPDIEPIIRYAGRDISEWFNPRTGDVTHHVDPDTNCLVVYTPQGRFVHIPPPYPTTDWANDFGTPWWKDPKYRIGKLTSKTRNIIIINTLSLTENEIEVCVEETLYEILTRYLMFNTHAASYTWMHDLRVLDMDKTLEENGIHEEIPDIEDMFKPQLYLYFNDDLTEA